MKIPKPAWNLFLVAGFLSAGVLTNASAATTNLVPVADTGIREPSGGSGTLSPIQVGVSFTGTPRNRALFKFSLTNIPANAVITAASLKLVVITTSRPAASFDLNRLLKDWDETQATWVARLTSTPWVVAGGLAGDDYASSPTAAAVLAATGTSSTFSSTAMVSDLQMWLNNPGTNFGWILMAAGEAFGTGKQIAAREDAVNTPLLTVEYTAPEPPSLTVSITNPANNAVFAAPANVQIEATATVASGSVTNVAFFGNGAPLGSDQTAPFGITTGSLAAGGYALTAVATAAGISATSSVVNITVVSPSPTPTVSITNPPNGSVFIAPATVQIEADAAVSSGSVTNVDFFGNGTPLGSDQTAPFSITTASLAVGSYALTAVATAAGVSSTSAVVSVTVNAGANVAPSVTITNPIDNAVLSSSANVTINASASDTDGSVTNVQFFDGLVSLGNDSTSPYSATARLAIGAHTLTAVASDNFGATTTSAPVHVTLARYLPAITNRNIAILLQPIATGMAAPDYAISPPGDTNRLFVVEQNGLLRIIQNGTLLPGSALDIQSRVQPPLNPASANDERGFLGLAFHPGFNNPVSPGFRTLYTYNSEMIPEATTPTYVVPTTATNNYKNVVNEWKVSTTNANVVDPASRREVISFGKTAGNHNGGTIAFGSDGYLYLALGDGGDANDVGASHIEPGGNAQNLSTPLGKMLRFDALHPTLTPGSPDPISANGQYRIPTTNPFQGPGQVPEIYAYGLRNPYRFAFDRGNGDLILADVGQNNIEEIDRIVLGGNYGWAIKEGDFLFNRTNGPSGNAGTIGAPPGNRSPGIPAGLIDPITGTLGTLEYDHNDGISVTGGFVYRGTAIPELFGKYVFGDLAIRNAPPRVDGRLFYADLQTGLIYEFRLPQFPTGILPNGLTVHGFGEDADGELYALVTNTSANGTGGIVYKFVPVRLTFQVSGNLLDISWPARGARLETQTNSPGVGLGTNWVTVANSAATNRVVVPIDTANGSVFYRLALP